MQESDQEKHLSQYEKLCGQRLEQWQKEVLLYVQEVQKERIKRSLMVGSRCAGKSQSYWNYIHHMKDSMASGTTDRQSLGLPQRRLGSWQGNTTRTGPYWEIVDEISTHVIATRSSASIYKHPHPLFSAGQRKADPWEVQAKPSGWQRNSTSLCSTLVQWT